MKKAGTEQPAKEQSREQSTFRDFGIRPVYPRIQAVVNQILDIQHTKECRVEVHKSEQQTILTLIPDKTGVATAPEGVFPNQWKLTAAFPMHEGTASNVVFILNGRAIHLKPYRILRPKANQPGLRLHAFAKTEGRTTRAFIVQVNKDRECLVTEWSICVLDARRAKRTREGQPVRERLPLHDLERTKRALPATLVPLAEDLCFLYNVCSSNDREAAPVVVEKVEEKATAKS